MYRLVWLLLACLLVATVGSTAGASPDPISQETSCPCGEEVAGADAIDDDLVWWAEQSTQAAPTAAAQVVPHEASVRSFDHDGGLFRPPDLR